MGFGRGREGYQALEASELGFEEQSERATRTSRSSWLHAGLRYCLIALGVMAAFVVGMHFNYRSNLGLYDHSQWAAAPRRCENVTVRREWRSLSKEEKSEYLRAVQCTRKLPSLVGVEQAMYDDLPWVHSRYGEYTHGTAAFLAWHRYFIHTYEKVLREQCDYKGHLTYWDWSLDWENLPGAPVWSNELGFGGDGNSSDAESVAYGHCVTEGPFARLEIMNYGRERKPHCLSRGFLQDEDKLRARGDSVSPRALERLLLDDDYSSFILHLEYGAHNSLPFAIRGDFYKFTAPNDPVFFLHHTQLDRIWWKWQHRSPDRAWEYSGKVKFEHDGEEWPVSLDDSLDVGPLGPTVKVAQIMETESEMLCYRY